MVFVNKNRRPSARPGLRARASAIAPFLGVFCTATVLAQVPQASAPVTETRVRGFAQQAQRESRGDATALVLALDRLVRDTWGELETFPISIVRREDLRVTLSTPYMAYRRSVIDMLRTKRPITAAPWVDAVVIAVGPERLGAPDIETVVLTRDGKEVPPVRSTLRTMTFSNGAGEQGALHAGDIQFPVSALAPGGTVTLTLRPASGEPFVYTFSETELATAK